MVSTANDAPKKTDTVPPLENGDRLTRHEFERRFNAMPHLKHAELIEGVVYMPAALRYRSHGRPHGYIIAWLAAYEMETPGVEFADSPTVRLDLDNDPQPDAILRIDEACGGQSRISDDDYVEGAPELIVEIASSSASYDLYDKQRAYRRNGVKEYIVWQVLDRTIRWFQLQAGAYVEQRAGNNGIMRSAVFPGLNLNIPALLDGTLADVLAEVQRGTATDDHQQFVEQLSRKS